MTADQNSETTLSFHFSCCYNRGNESIGGGGVHLWNLTVFCTQTTVMGT